MIKINKKQKIIMICILAVVLICGYKYTYSKNNVEIISQEDTKIQEENEIENETTNKEKIFIHVSGAVNNEGVFELNENARVSDAIQQAGGFKENAYTKDINLAYKLEDGMKVYVPTKEEVENNKNEKTEISSNNQNYIDNSLSTNIKTENNIENNKKININTANQEELETLPGIGSSTAMKIINYRKEKGKFKNIEDIKNVSGIGEAKYNKIKELISV